MKVKVYNQTGEAVGEQELNPAVFGVEANEALVHQAVIAQQSNARVPIAHAKDRSEVRGGGRKPWRQKGTGRARAGSIRSPLWKGGGVTFGPSKTRNFSQKINKKMKKRALLMVLSDKAKDNKLVVLDKLEVGEIKTKKINELLSKLPLTGRKLVILEKSDVKITKSLKNIPRVAHLRADSLNVLDVITANSLLITQSGLKIIEKVFAK